MNDINTPTETNNERTYTQTEMEAIVRDTIRQVEEEREARATGTPLPLDIISELEVSPAQLQTNFKRFKKDVQKYTNDEWFKPERVNKSLLPKLKAHKVDTQQIVNTIYKITENTRFQAAVAVDIYERLQYALEAATDVQEVRQIMEQCSTHSKRLAVYGIHAAKQQEREAKGYSDEAIKIPVSAQHVEPEEPNDKFKDAYSGEFLSAYYKAQHDEKMEQQVASSNRGNSSRKLSKRSRKTRYKRQY